MRIFTIIIFLASSFQLFGQNAAELASLKEITVSSHHHHEWEIAKNNNSTMEITLSSMFLFYKFFISSQDSQSCSFTKSCSVYAVETFKKQGFFRGMLDTFDRLMRCNGLSPEKYPYDYNAHLSIDPVRNIRYEEL